MDDLLQAEADLPLDEKSRAAFKRARKNIAKAMGRPKVKELLREQREAIERDREDRARKLA